MSGGLKIDPDSSPSLGRTPKRAAPAPRSGRGALRAPDLCRAELYGGSAKRPKASGFRDLVAAGGNFP